MKIGMEKCGEIKEVGKWKTRGQETINQDGRKIFYIRNDLLIGNTFFRYSYKFRNLQVARVPSITSCLQDI